MNKKLIILLLICSTLTLGCTDNPVDEPLIELVNESILNKSIINKSIPVSTTPELDNLIQFLEEDKTDEIIYNADSHRGIDYFVCCGYSRQLAKNASEYNITMGGISLRDHEHVQATKYYHAMNYVIVDNSFVIIEPQEDSIHYLDTIYYHWGCNFRYITVFPNANMMTNFGKHKETIDIDVLDGYNETEIINKWRTQHETK